MMQRHHGKRQNTRQHSVAQTPENVTQQNRRSSVSDRLSESKYTPYCKRTVTRIRLDGGVPPEEDPSTLYEDIIGLTWDAYRVSPLTNFKRRELDLKQYGRKLSEHISLENTANIQNTYRTIFSILPHLKMTALDSEAVQVKVITRRENKEETLYLGIFLSHGSEEDTDQGFTNLPLLLCRGPVNFKRTVHFHLRRFFDCCIQPLKISWTDMMWLNAIFIASRSYHPSSMCQFYLLSPFLLHPSRICVSIKLSEILQVWNRIHDGSSPFLQVDEVTNLIAAIEEHILKLNLGSLFLSCQEIEKIVILKDVISSNGKLKLCTEQGVKQILSFLSELCRIVECSCPPLGQLEESTD